MNIEKSGIRLTKGKMLYLKEKTIVKQPKNIINMSKKMLKIF